MKRTVYLAAAIIVIAGVILIINYYNNRVDKEILRVEVLNGSGENGIAKKTAQYLKDSKLDVIIISNAEYDTISETVVIDRMKNNRAYAKYVAAKMHCSNVIDVVDSSLYIDVTVIVGKDYNEYLKE